MAILGLTGVTVIETNVAGFTVRLAEPLTPFCVAVIVAVPVAVAVATPATLTVTAGFEDAHVELAVMPNVEPSL